MFNFSNKNQVIIFKETLFLGSYTDFTTGEKITLTKDVQITEASPQDKIYFGYYKNPLMELFFHCILGSDF